ncbi:MAG: hypothetical protein WCO57_02155 [Verrucomicrobiota bacterium]
MESVACLEVMHPAHSGKRFQRIRRIQPPAEPASVGATLNPKSEVDILQWGKKTTDFTDFLVWIFSPFATSETLQMKPISICEISVICLRLFEFQSVRLSRFARLWLI